MYHVIAHGVVAGAGAGCSALVVAVPDLSHSIGLEDAIRQLFAAISCAALNRLGFGCLGM